MRSAENFPFRGKFSEVYFHLNRRNEKFETTEIVPRRRVQLTDNDEIEIEVIPETQLPNSQNSREGMRINENNPFLFHGQGATTNQL